MSGAGASRGLEALPGEARGAVVALREGLEGAAGANLAALVVYGSVVRGGWVAGRSDIDLIVVLHDDSLGSLEALSETLTLARFRDRVEAMILRRDALERASDVFPLLYDDVQGCHVVLAGSDPFVDLEIADTHRRLRIEQELREAGIRLRRAVVDSRGSEAVLAGAVARKLKQLRGPLHALLRLKGLTCGERLEEVLPAAGGAWSVDTGPLGRVAADPRAAHVALAALLDAAVLDVDALEPGERP